MHSTDTHTYANSPIFFNIDQRRLTGISLPGYFSVGEMSADAVWCSNGQKRLMTCQCSGAGKWRVKRAGFANEYCDDGDAGGANLVMNRVRRQFSSRRIDNGRCCFRDSWNRFAERRDASELVKKEEPLPVAQNRAFDACAVWMPRVRFFARSECRAFDFSALRTWCFRKQEESGPRRLMNVCTIIRC